MNLWQLKKGSIVRLEDGGTALVLAPTQDGKWVRVRYLSVPDDPNLEGTEDLCAESELVGLAERPDAVKPR